MKVLFTSTQGVGHFRPLRPFIASALRVGHEVAAVVPPALEAMARRDGLPVYVGDDPPAAELESVWSEVRRSSHENAEQLVLGEIFGRLKTDALLPTVREAIMAYRPDVVIHESAEFAGPIAAEEAGLPHATVGVSQSRTDMLDVAAPNLDRRLPLISKRLRRTPYLTLFPACLDANGFPQIHRFKAPQQPAKQLNDYWGGRSGPLVYITFGTVTADTPIAAAAYRVALDAVGQLNARVLMTTGELGDGAQALAPAANTHVEPWVDQEDVLDCAAAVVCHGGSGTILGTLARGVPLIVVPLFADQQDNAENIARLGAGIAVPHEERPVPALRQLTPHDGERMRAAIETVLRDESYRTSARRIAGEMNSLPPIDAVWDVLTSSRRADPFARDGA